MASPRAEITPEVLKWARERARYSPSEAARKVGTTEERYMDYEEGDEHPTLKQLYRLAKAFRQSIGTFYLDAPPDEEEPLTEMRRLSDTPPNRESSSLATAIEDVLQRRDNALEMFKDLGEEPPSWELSATVDDDSEAIASKVRRHLRVDVEDQLEHENAYQALRYWRGSLEENGILCFQVPGVSVSEMRGFAISRHPLPIVAVNRKDSPTARIFTLLHEVGHILLDDSILHERYPAVSRSTDVNDDTERDVERFCNEFAAATIIPGEHLLSLSQVQRAGKKAAWDRSSIKSIASNYNISPAVTVRRLYTFDRIADSIFYNLIEDFDDYEPEGRSSGSGNGGDYYRTHFSELGSFYSDLAFQSYHNGSITLSELSSILDVRVDNIPRYEKEVYS